MTTVINFYAGPSAGKSTMAAQLFGLMKARRMNVEYVPEFAKTLTWRQANCLDDQLYVLGNQHHELYTLRGQVDYIITDSPLLLSNYYYSLGFNKIKEFTSRTYFEYVFKDLVTILNSMYESIDFFVHRGHRLFVQAGRNQNEEESKKIDQEILKMLQDQAVDYTEVYHIDDVVQHLETLGIWDARKD